nr:MAG TPA: hypothetical protein [Bacteriophage sp.]
MFFIPNLPLWNGPLRIPVSAGEPRWAGFLCGKGSFQRVGTRYEIINPLQSTNSYR